MAQQPMQTPGKLPQRNLLMMAAFIAAAVLIGFFGGQTAQHVAATPQDKLRVALEAFRSGYDQTALATLTPLADEGNPKAQYWLADIYENGLGVAPDLKASLALLEKSAAQGFVPAERHLGDLYLEGNEALQDFGKARSWLSKAAFAGDGKAELRLGHIYALGLGVPRDMSEAYAWYENAVLRGDGLAKERRDDIITRMSPDQIAKGEQDAKDIAAQIRAAKP